MSKKVAVVMSINNGELMDCEAVFATRELAESYRALRGGGFYISEQKVIGETETQPESSLRVRVIKEGFGYWDEHHVGEEFSMPIRHITKCIQKGYIEIVVNNMGNNLPYDEPVTSMFDEAYVETNVPQAAEAPIHEPLVVEISPETLENFQENWAEATSTPPEFKMEYLCQWVPLEEDGDETK